jgi:PAS domain S-box-containing protein
MDTDDNLPLMTWRARPDMSCERVSAAWRDFTGLTQEDPLSQGVHPEDLARWLDTYVRAFDERQPVEIEYRLRRHDGEYHWVLERAAPLYAENGAFVGYVGGCADIEDQKRLEQYLATARHLPRRDGADDLLLAGVKVLVVDPDRNAREALVRMLGVAGADVRAVASTGEALEMIGAWHPDVLLSGESDSLIRALRSLGANTYRSGYDTHLAKPVEPVALLATVARLAA